MLHCGGLILAGIVHPDYVVIRSIELHQIRIIIFILCFFTRQVYGNKKPLVRCPTYIVPPHRMTGRTHRLVVTYVRDVKPRGLCVLCRHTWHVTVYTQPMYGVCMLLIFNVRTLILIVTYACHFLIFYITQCVLIYTGKGTAYVALVQDGLMHIVYKSWYRYATYYVRFSV